MQLGTKIKAIKVDQITELPTAPMTMGTAGEIRMIRTEVSIITTGRESKKLTLIILRKEDSAAPDSRVIRNGARLKRMTESITTSTKMQERMIGKMIRVGMLMVVARLAHNLEAPTSNVSIRINKHLLSKEAWERWLPTPSQA